MKIAKRFYETVSTGPVKNGYGVLLDGRALKTPGKLNLIVKSPNAAKLIATEWDAQTDQIRPETMPVTRLVNVSIELTPLNRDKLALEVRQYAMTDLLCYRASEPAKLKERQAELWDPILDWAAKQGIDLKTTDTIIAIHQDEKSLSVIEDYARSQNDLFLTLFVHLIAVFGSSILGLAVMKKRLSGTEAFALSRLDNLYQIEQWGQDEEAAEIAKTLEAEIISLCQLLEA